MSKERYQKLFSEYKILVPLGAGGMGEVFLAEDLNLSRSVAIKFLHSRTSNQSEILEKRFHNEAKILASLNHPNIVSIYNFGKKEDISYIVMEYIEGKTLARVISQKTLLPMEAFQILRKLVRGVTAAHEKGILHRDIKPANIILTENKAVKLVDFGISKSLIAEDQNYTQTNHFIGTVHYMAPELLLGKDPSMMSDIFSIGVIFFEMLLGKNPFLADNQFKTIENIKTKKLVLPKKIAKSLPGQFPEILKKMVAVDPAQRYQSSSELLEDLKKVREDEIPTLMLEVTADELALEEEDLAATRLSEEVNATRVVGGPKKEPDMDLESLNLFAEEEQDFSDYPEIDLESFSGLTVKNKLVQEAVDDFNIQKEEATAFKVQSPQSFQYESQDEYAAIGSRPFKTYVISTVFIAAIVCGLYFKVEPFREAVSQYVSVEKLLNKNLGLSIANLGGNKATNDFEDPNAEVPQKRGISSIPSAHLEFAPVGSFFHYEIVETDEKTGKVLYRQDKKMKMGRSRRGIATASVSYPKTGKRGEWRMRANNFVPPLDSFRFNGEQNKIKISGSYNSIYPLEVGKTMEFSHMSLLRNGSFNQVQENCQVAREESLNIAGQSLGTFVVYCKNSVGGESWTYYSPLLKKFVRKQTRRKAGNGYKLETMNLVRYKIPKIK